jgi:hypothetical protein
MNRRTLSHIARVFALAALFVVALSATTVKPIHPESGGENAPVRIAILADHYTTAQEQQFNYDVENLIKYGLLADGFYKSYASSIQVTSYFDETPAGQASRFGFELGPGDGNCTVKAPDDILSKLLAAVGTGTVLPSHFLVIGNHNYNIGCTSGNWSYMAVDAIGTDVLQHELGHLVGLLFDEWAMPSNGTTPHPGLISDQFNCAPAPPPPPFWMNNPKFPLAKALPACDLYTNGVVHSHDSCRMGAMHHRMFCDVCKEAMKNGFGFVNSAPPPYLPPPSQGSNTPAARPGFRIMNAAFQTAPGAQTANRAQPSNSPRPVMRLLVEFDPGSQIAPTRPVKLEIKQRVFATAVYVPNHRRVGEFLYEIIDNAGVREVGIIADSSFKSRSFQGGPHETGPVKPVQMFLDVPNEDAKTAADNSRNLRAAVYRIPKTVTNPIIDKNTWAELRKTNNFEKVAEVSLAGPSPARQQK